jgi:acyl-coenzyme A thioesterase PaaI-like protein
VRSPRPRSLLAAGLLLLALSAPAPAGAYDAEVSATTAAQLYAVMPAWPGTILRRRYLQTLGLDVLRIGEGDAEPGDPEVLFKLRMRLDADYGMPASLTTYSPYADAFVPGLSPCTIDLMYGYLEGRNFAHGTVGFRVGRQYTMDSLGWWSFDGGLVRIASPWHVGVEAYGGLEQRGGLPVSLPRFEPSGMWRGDRKGYENAIYPQFQGAAIAPAFGIAIETTQLELAHARIDYRKVQNTGVSIVSALPDPATGTYASIDETRTSSERVGMSANAGVPGTGSVRGGMVYSLYDALVGSYYAAADVHPTAWSTVGADYDFLRPTFDADAIWSSFAHNPMRTAKVAVTIFDVAMSTGIRTYYTDGDPSAYAGPTQATASAAERDFIGDIRARVPRQLSLPYDGGIHGMIESGDRGYRRGVDADLRMPFPGGRYSIQGRVSQYAWSDALRPDRGGTQTGFVLGGTFRPSPIARTTVELEQEMSSLVGHRYRIVGLLDLEVGP